MRLCRCVAVRGVLLLAALAVLLLGASARLRTWDMSCIVIKPCMRVFALHT